jgi:DNA-binding transcriptional regulator YiaG
MSTTLDKNITSNSQLSSKNPTSSIYPAIFIVNYSAVTPTESHDRLHLAALSMTTSGVKLELDGTALPQPTLPIKTTQQTVNELRKISGLTWEQLAQLFNVSRRSIHFWASGQQLSAKNEAKLNQSLDTVQYISRGSASINRSLLMEIASNGKSHLELLKTGEYNQVRDSIGAGNIPRSPKTAQPTKEKSSTLPNPGDLVDALQDSIHREVGRARLAKSLRSKKNSAQQ